MPARLYSALLLVMFARTHASLACNYTLLDTAEYCQTGYYGGNCEGGNAAFCSSADLAASQSEDACKQQCDNEAECMFAVYYADVCSRYNYEANGCTQRVTLGRSLLLFKKECFSPGSYFVYGTLGYTSCASGQIEEESACQAAAASAGMAYQASEDVDSYPRGCYLIGGTDVRFNVHPSGQSESTSRPICNMAFPPSSYFVYGTLGYANCASGKIEEESACQDAAASAGKIYSGSEDLGSYPQGCYILGATHVYFNAHPLGQSESTSMPICSLAFPPGSWFVYGNVGDANCASGQIEQESVCQAAAASAGKSYSASEDLDSYPQGCYILGATSVWFNAHPSGQSESSSAPICSLAFPLGSEFVYGNVGDANCASGQIEEESVCQAAAASAGKSYSASEDLSSYPQGCYILGATSVWFNAHPSGQSQSNSMPICRMAFPLGSEFFYGSVGDADCASGQIEEESVCRSAAASGGKPYKASEDKGNYPQGCYLWKGVNVWFNLHPSGSGESMSLPICKAFTMSIRFAGDYNVVVGQQKEVFLQECSDKLAPVTCVDVRPGSIVVDIRGDKAAVRSAATDMESNGLSLNNFELEAQASPQLASVGGMSGDPIVVINSHRIKFELPLNEKSLMWADDTITILAAADLLTPDKKSQWFTDFVLLANKIKVAQIQRREVTPTQNTIEDDVKSLSVALFEQNIATARAKLGTYDIGNGTFRLTVLRGAQMIGPVQKEIVRVNASSISFTLSPERAKKFSDDSLAMKYVHLDLQIHSMQATGVKAGILAELYGFVPMSAKTVMQIKKVHM